MAWTRESAAGASNSAEPECVSDEFEYAGFWVRLWAYIIDTLLLLIVTLSILFVIYGGDYWFGDYWQSEEWFAGHLDFLVSWVFPALAVILFWIHRQATPGKMAISAKIVDAKTGQPPSTGQCVGRYFAYIPSTVFLGLGFLWIAVDAKKQGWHDKLAGTAVIRKKHPEKVKFQSGE